MHCYNTGNIIPKTFAQNYKIEEQIFDLFRISMKHRFRNLTIIFDWRSNMPHRGACRYN